VVAIYLNRFVKHVYRFVINRFVINRFVINRFVYIYTGGALTQAKSSLSSWFSNWKSSNDKETKDSGEVQS
jgi:hypothetical protein